MDAAALSELEDLIALTPDFPQDGVLFRDISPLLAARFNDVIDAMSGLFSADDITHTDAFAGIDARGFVFASALASRHSKNMIMIRKSGKLPPPVLTETCTLEYGTATLQMKAGSGGRIILLDDVLATGGTMQAAADLCAKAGYAVGAMAALIDLQFLNRFSWRGQTVRSLFQYKEA